MSMTHCENIQYEKVMKKREELLEALRCQGMRITR